MDGVTDGRMDASMGAWFIGSVAAAHLPVCAQCLVGFFMRVHGDRREHRWIIKDTSGSVSKPYDCDPVFLKGDEAQKASVEWSMGWFVRSWYYHLCPVRTKTPHLEIAQGVAVAFPTQEFWGVCIPSPASFSMVQHNSSGIRKNVFVMSLNVPFRRIVLLDFWDLSPCLF